MESLIDRTLSHRAGSRVLWQLLSTFSVVPGAAELSTVAGVVPRMEGLTGAERAFGSMCNHGLTLYCASPP